MDFITYYDSTKNADMTGTHETVYISANMDCLPGSDIEDVIYAVHQVERRPHSYQNGTVLLGGNTFMWTTYDDEDTLNDYKHRELHIVLAEADDIALAA